MEPAKPWYKLVRVIGGPLWLQGQTGYLDETTGVVFFSPVEDPPTRETEFGDAFLGAILTLETVRKQAERTKTKAKSEVTDAFQT